MPLPISPPHQLLVIAPTIRELGGLAAGRMGATVASVTGLGEAAVLSLASRLTEHRPALVLSLGFAGALAPGLRTGTLVLCDSFRSHYYSSPPGSSYLEADRPPLRIVAQRLAQAGIGANRGALLTAGAPLMNGAAKRQAGLETSAAIVDMEGYWLAQVARTYQVPFIALRAVLDPVDQALPPVVAAVVAGQGRHEWRYAAAALLANPLRMAQLISLASQSWRAQKALRQAAQVLVPALAAQTSATLRDHSASLHNPQKEGNDHDYPVG